MGEEKKRILTVDDVVTNLMVITNLLSHDFDVRVAKSGAIALNILSRLSVDLILLDIEMPVMSGYELLAIIQSKPELSQIPVICVTSHADKETTDRILRAGAKDVLYKPVDPALLEKKIFNLLDCESGRLE